MKASKYILILAILLFAFMPLAIAQEEDAPHEEDEGTCVEDNACAAESEVEVIIQEKTAFAAKASVIIGVVGVLLIIFLSMKGKRKKQRIKNSIIYSSIFIILVLLGYSTYIYKISGAETEGFLVCEGETCYLAQHIHAEVPLYLCGEFKELGLEGGKLAETHTHKERNRIHWHAKLKVDPATKQILDTTPLTMGAFMDNMGARFNSTCVDEYCNGDLCPDGKPGTMTMIVNSIPSTEFRDYVWKDGDIVEIRFE